MVRRHLIFLSWLKVNNFANILFSNLIICQTCEASACYNMYKNKLTFIAISISSSTKSLINIMCHCVSRVL